MTMAFNHDAFMVQLRKRMKDGKVPQSLYDAIIGAVAASQAGGASPATPATTAEGEPKWLTAAYAEIGTKEIAGPKHNAKIVQWFAAAKAAWFKDDETPWCGAFAAYCMIAAGQPTPKKGEAVRAKAWASWGKDTPPRVGAVAVFGREGGGHVGFVVGESATMLYILGGNQSNAVNIMPIAKSRLLAFRWPAGLPLSDRRLPAMSGGTISTNER
jgi:uncharacterized protein (TIGR02594 family)